ncbi:MAG TPA: pyridoxal phosphate-dependent aminotransferase [Candidatus Limnocylindrales bacterium]|nr:pyridoxal phosphate-dependent aminotransferase [Candidatus Limnocylindrales bacterium]
MISRKARFIEPSPTMAIDSKAKEMKNRGIDVISFGAGEPDFDTPVNIREAAVAAIDGGHTRYTPAAGSQELREAICRKFELENDLKYRPAQIVVSNGAKHSLSNVFTAILDPGDEVLIPAPFWVSYPEMVKLNDGIPVIVNTTESNLFKLDLQTLSKACSGRTKALILNNPCNPTGQLYTRNELQLIGDFCVEHKILIVADEIYEKLIYGGHSFTSIAALSEQIKEYTIVVNGVSKSYSMTGWRIGYSASSLAIAEAMAAIQSHCASNPNSIAQKAALQALLGPQESVEAMRMAFEERCKYMLARITAIPGLSAHEPLGTFYMFVNITGATGKTFRDQRIVNSDDFAALLLDSKNTAVVPGTGFGAANHIRLSFALSMGNIVEGLNRLEAFVADLGES